MAPRPLPTTPAPLSAMDILSLLTGLPNRAGTTQFQRPTPTTPPALSSLELVPHGSGPAYPVSRSLGLPIPGSTPR
jgi:hypothetical protein